jgi:alkyl hydroperoxide reductase subunit AhpC
LAQLRHAHDRFRAASVRVVAVGLGTPTRTREFRASMRLPFPVLCDPRRRVYRQYGLMRMQPGDSRAPGTMARLAIATARHGGALSRDQDMLQLGGVFIVDTAGILRYAHRARAQHDNPSPDSLLRVAAPLTRPDAQQT